MIAVFSRSLPRVVGVGRDHGVGHLGCLCTTPQQCSTDGKKPARILS